MMRHVSRTHRVALDWLFDRINLDAKIQIKYVESKNQHANILTKGSFTRNEWYNLLHLFHILNDTTFSCSLFSNSHSFLSAGKQSEMWKALRLGSTRDSQVWTLEERSTKSGWYSVQHASGNGENTSEDSEGLSETHASGNRQHT